jgi:hypothetical protein
MLPSVKESFVMAGYSSMLVLSGQRFQCEMPRSPCTALTDHVICRAVLK